MPLDDDARRRAAETKRQRTVRAILDAVGVVDVEEGQVTMAAVAAAAGVSEATVYRYFPTKDELQHAWFVDSIERALDPSPDPASALNVLVMHMVSTFDEATQGGLKAWQARLREAINDSSLEPRAVAMHLVRDLLNYVPLKSSEHELTSEALEYALEHDDRFAEWGGLKAREARQQGRDADAS